jgi:hypothetical protein
MPEVLETPHVQPIAVWVLITSMWISPLKRCPFWIAQRLRLLLQSAGIELQTRLPNGFESAKPVEGSPGGTMKWAPPGTFS